MASRSSPAGACVTPGSAGAFGADVSPVSLAVCSSVAESSSRRRLKNNHNSSNNSNAGIEIAAISIRGLLIRLRHRSVSSSGSIVCSALTCSCRDLTSALRLAPRKLLACNCSSKIATCSLSSAILFFNVSVSESPKSN